MPRVSVILPCYNAAETVTQTIESLLQQSYRDFEIIFFEDGSTDETLAIAESFAASDARLNVIASEHVGIVEALRLACAASQGELLARMDGDDIAHPERLRLQVELLDANDHVALCGSLIEGFGMERGPGRVRYEKWLNSVRSHEQMIQELFVECPIAHPTFCMPRERYEAAGGYREAGWAEDYDLLMRIVQQGGELAKVPETLLSWRHHGDRLSSKDSRYSPENFRALKRHYLRQGYLQGERRFIQWGAGEVGKAWLREWNDDERPEAVVDINPRKIGRTIHDCPVIAPEDLPAPGEAFVLAAVGAVGAREDIRAWMQDHGYTECADFLFLA